MGLLLAAGRGRRGEACQVFEIRSILRSGDGPLCIREEAVAVRQRENRIEGARGDFLNLNKNDFQIYLPHNFLKMVKY